MSNPTTPFNWQMPTNTDLVTDLPADFEVFGQAVATSMADLLGGTTGQILSKNSNTDMDFVWIANDQGDITGVTATSPLTGGGTSGAITIGIQSASTTQSGAVQLTDSTSSTSTTTAATPNAVKSAYDLANGAIPKSTVTTSGDVIYATGSSAVTRLGIGSAGQVLTVSGGVPTWATATGSSGPSFRAYIGTSQTLSSATWTKLAFNTENWDTDSNYNTSTYRFTPTTSGKFTVDVSCFMYDGPEYRLALYKNGSEYAFLDIKDNTSVSDMNPNLQGSTAVDLNGSSDYIEVYGFMRAGSTRRVDGGSTNNWFTATWMRS